MSTSKPQYLTDPGDPLAFATTTAIDRTKCTRTVPLKVLGLGLSRTGTVSLRQALIELGYGDCYHFSTVVQENPLDQAMWVQALRGKFLPASSGCQPFAKQEWDALLGHCQSVTDAPCNVFWEELLQTYPDAKVILTVRDSPEQWHESYKQTLGKFTEDFIENDQLMEKFDPLTREFYRVFTTHSPAYAKMYHDYQTGEETAKEYYKWYVSEIQRRVPSEKLLVFNVNEGWSPLCKFLGTDIPESQFPRRFDRTTFAKTTAALRSAMLGLGSAT